MKKKTLPFSIFLALIFGPLFSFAQQSINGIDLLAGKLVKSTRAKSRLNILLQTDKAVYASNDPILFKALLLDSVSGKTSLNKGTLYVDLADNNDQVYSKIFLHADRLQSSGSVIIPDTLKSGFYWLRAFTGFSAADGSANLAITPLMIINPRQPLLLHPIVPDAKTSSGIAGKKWTHEIFVEGGALMSGADNTVVIKLTGENGKPVAMPGIIKDKQLKEVGTFTTNTEGLGKFVLNPTTHGKYFVYVKTDKGLDSLGSLPAVDMHGAQLSVTAQNEEAVKVKVMLEDSLFSPQFSTYLLAVQKDSICFAGVGQGMYELAIPGANLPSGEVHLLLFNQNGTLLSYRNLYHEKVDPVVTITSLRTRYGQRQKVNATVNVTDPSGKPLMAMLSVSVADLRLIDTLPAGFTDPLTKHDPSTLDLYMMTTPKPFTDLTIAENKPAAVSAEAANPFVYAGRITDKNKNPLHNYEISLVGTKGGLTYLQDTTDAEGKFSIALPEFDNEADYNIKVKNLKGSTANFEIIRTPFTFPTLKTPEELKNNWAAWQANLVLRAKEKHLDTLISQEFRGMLKPVTVKSPGKGSGKSAENAYVLTQQMLLDGNYRDVGYALLTVPGVHLLNGLVVMGGPEGFKPSATDEPILVIDGQQVPYGSDNANQGSPLLGSLSILNVREIESIRVMSGTEGASYGSRGGHGVIEIKTGYNKSPIAAGKNESRISLTGYHVPKPFVVKDYDDLKDQSIKDPDYHTTLYWNGDLLTNQLGKADFHFSTGDAPATYAVLITGVTVRGQKISRYVTFVCK